MDVMTFEEIQRDEFVFWTLKHLFLGQRRLGINCICPKVLSVFVKSIMYICNWVRAAD